MVLGLFEGKINIVLSLYASRTMKMNTLENGNALPPLGKPRDALAAHIRRVLCEGIGSEVISHIEDDTMYDFPIPDASQLLECTTLKLLDDGKLSVRVVIPHREYENKEGIAEFTCALPSHVPLPDEQRGEFWQKLRKALSADFFRGEERTQRRTLRGYVHSYILPDLSELPDMTSFKIIDGTRVQARVLLSPTENPTHKRTISLDFDYGGEADQNVPSSEVVFIKVDNGNIVPEVEQRMNFAIDLRRIILDKVLGGRAGTHQYVQGVPILFTLPHAEQIMDFVRLKPSKTEGSIDVEYSMPCDHEHYYWNQAFEYKPPSE